MENCSRCHGPMGIVLTKAFDKALGLAKKIIGRPGIPALTGVHLYSNGGKLTLVTTDLEVTIQQEIDGGIDGSAAALVPCKALADAVKAHGGDTLELHSDGVQFTAADFTLRQLALEDFPALREGEAETIAELDAQRFVTLFKGVEKAVSKDEARPILTAVLIEAEGERLTLVATDSYRLHVAEAGNEYPADGKALVPGRALKLAAQAIGKAEGTVTIRRTGPSEIRFVLPGGVSLISREIEGEFPNWRRLIPEPSANVLTFDGSFLAQVKAASNFARENSPVRIEMNGEVTITADSPDLGSYKATIPGASYQGDDLTVAYNPTYLADALACSKATTLEVRDGLKPAAMRGIDVTALVMPVRLPAAVG